MKKYRITFTPEEPYFFGNEKTFKYPGQKNDGKYGSLYYIRSEKMPSQTTLLGALRYIVLPVKKADFSYSDQELEANRAAAGRAGFDIASSVCQEFGMIKSLSPMFITKGDNIYIPAPLDHNMCEKRGGSAVRYHPFEDYADISTPDGIKKYARDYDVKTGIADGAFMRLSDNAIIDSSDIFTSTVRVGINRTADDKGFFKKEYCCMGDGYAFAVDAVLDLENACDDVKAAAGSGTIAYLGQNKSVFTVRISETEEKIEDLVKDSLSRYKPASGSKLYVFGDALADDGLYADTLWASVVTRDYRPYVRDMANRGRVDKGAKLYKLVRQGSVFLTEEADVWLDRYRQMPEYVNAAGIGYCNIVVIE